MGEAEAANAEATASALTDWNSISDAYKPYIAQCYAKGIINGNDDGTFAPSNSLTRAEAAAVIVRLIDSSAR